MLVVNSSGWGARQKPSRIAPVKRSVRSAHVHHLHHTPPSRACPVLHPVNGNGSFQRYTRGSQATGRLRPVSFLSETERTLLYPNFKPLRGNRTCMRASSATPLSEDSDWGKSQQTAKAQEAGSNARQVVSVESVVNAAVDSDGNVAASRQEEVRVEGGLESMMTADTGSTVVDAALTAIDMLRDTPETEQEARELVKELEARCRMMDDRIDMLEKKLVEIAKEALDDDRNSNSALQAAALEVAAEDEGIGLEQVNKIQSRLTEVMTSGQFESLKQVRENLMIQEWELTQKSRAQRRGICDFEAWCVANNIEVDYALLGKLYEAPCDEALLTLLPPRLRSMARSCVEKSESERWAQVYQACTAMAKEMAEDSSMESLGTGVGKKILGFVRKILPFKIPFIG